ncbi:hypothetical protein [Citrobacter sp. 172116965]|uniref:hypothetical protein n=1 Tax=Citrobacter TaxID=544 RepID=UPI0015DD0E7D|nr:hypothetical protein [Citrobacter sp. 172116965]QLK38572.1 hypothetical protein GPJ68_13970 [Citrobacter sp. 172116965]
MITEKNNVFYCDCGFSWRRGMSGSHNCEDGLRAKLTDMAVQLANAESKCRELAAESVTVKECASDVMRHVYRSKTYLDSSRVVDAIQGLQCAIERKAGKAPATDAFLAEVRASELDSLAGVAKTMLVKFSNQRCSSDMHEVVGWKMVLQQASNRATQLRKGAAL